MLFKPALVCELADCLTKLHVADLVNVFETFLPQLLLYPNPTDPLNGEAAALLMREPEAYNKKVKGRLHAALTILLEEGLSQSLKKRYASISSYSRKRHRISSQL